MKKLLITLSALAAAAASPAQEQPVTADQVLALVRYSQALQHHDLTGYIRNDKTGEAHPFVLSMREKIIQFAFSDPKQIIQLQTTDKGGVLAEVLNGKAGKVPPAKAAQPVRNSDINYEDLSMSFLWWSNPKLLEEEVVRTRRCYQVLVYSPSAKGPYRAVKLWVDKESGAMMKMQGYNQEGKMIKRFTVVSGQKIDGAWVLKEMRVEAYQPGASTPYGRTYLKIDKTKRL